MDFYPGYRFPCFQGLKIRGAWIWRRLELQALGQHKAIDACGQACSTGMPGICPCEVRACLLEYLLR